MKDYLQAAIPIFTFAILLVLLVVVFARIWFEYGRIKGRREGRKEVLDTKKDLVDAVITEMHKFRLCMLMEKDSSDAAIDAADPSPEICGDDAYARRGESAGESSEVTHDDK